MVLLIDVVRVGRGYGVVVHGGRGGRYRRVERYENKVETMWIVDLENDETDEGFFEWSRYELFGSSVKSRHGPSPSARMYSFRN